MLRSLSLLVALSLAVGACAAPGAPPGPTDGGTAPGTPVAPTEAATPVPVSPAAGTPTPMAQEPVELSVWTYWDGANADAFEQIAADYGAANPGVTITVSTVPGGELLTKYQTTAASGQTPDIGISDLVWVPQIRETGRLVDLRPLIERDGVDLNDFYPALLTFGQTPDGSQVSLPASTNNLGLIYNKELFAAAGLDPENPPQTWEDVRATSETIKNETGQWGYEFFTQPGDTGEGVTWQFQVFLWQAGGEFLNEDNTAAAFNSEAGARALTFWLEMIQADLAPLGPWGEFGKGNAAMVMDGSWMVGIWRTDAPFDFGVAPMPIPEGGEQATNMGGEQIFIFQSDEARQQAAWDFIRYFTSPEVQVGWNQATGFVPVQRSVAADPAYQDWLENEEPRLRVFVENQQYAHPRPNTPLYARVSFAFARQIERALNGQVTPEEALAAAEEEVNAILAGQ